MQRANKANIFEILKKRQYGSRILYVPSLNFMPEKNKKLLYINMQKKSENAFLTNLLLKQLLNSEDMIGEILATECYLSIEYSYLYK
jgi:hypothetical protein